MFWAGDWVTLVTAAAPLLAVAVAWALPSPGDPAPDAQARNTDDDVLSVSSLRGRVALIFYEDRDSTDVNKPLKDALARQLAAGERRTDAVVHAVADVSAFNIWPLRKVVNEAVRHKERGTGWRVYLDWDGTFRRAFGFKSGDSNVLLLDAEQRVVLAHAGAVTPEVAQRIMAALGR
jgi:predicted transcriptional regulator